ncbi:RusA family crossover junction endodeoxyribonuclease [Thermogutta sp.]|uniref:RusA family crossover junction endodeoxyribonuclease n=1 Tax=Thermogutta sp. TaxID=1962930 RepID=UPI0032201B5E
MSVKSTTQSITIDLPYPPSVNRYWRNVNGRMVLSREGRRYRQAVWDLLFVKRYLFGLGRFSGPVSVSLRIHPPDQRKRDLDNVLKAIFDALQGGGIIQDDVQIREVHAAFAEPVENGKVIVEVSQR